MKALWVVWVELALDWMPPRDPDEGEEDEDEEKEDEKEDRADEPPVVREPDEN